MWILQVFWIFLQVKVNSFLITWYLASYLLAVSLLGFCPIHSMPFLPAASPSQDIAQEPAEISWGVMVCEMLHRGWAAMRHAESVLAFASLCFDEPDHWNQGEWLKGLMPALEHVRMNARTWRAGESGSVTCVEKWKTLCVATGECNASP